MKNRILIVEDSDVNRDILEEILCDTYEILVAEDGEEAYEIIKSRHKSLSAVIIDLLMPKIEGKEFLRLLSKEERYSNLPILVATLDHNDKLESECLQLGAWDFVTKPYNPIVLKLRLNNIIGRSQTHLLQRIQILAETDALTGIYNRRFFMKNTAEMIRNERGETFALIRMDIDQFRLYNSSFGSEAGDELLVNIANQIVKDMAKAQFPHRTYGRIESDVFCICIPYQKQQTEEVICQVERGIQGFCSTYRLKVSFGIYIIEDPDVDMEKIYACSVDAARSCKNNLNQFYAYYSNDMGKREEKAQLLTNEMERALKEEQFLVYLQPKYLIETNSPCGAEALVRWMHPEWGLVSPGDFIPIFEQNGLIVQLDHYMWEHVCMLLHKWLTEGRQVNPVSVNISRISMYDPRIVQTLVTLTDTYEIPRYLLNLEITESAYMSNPDLMKNIIKGLREKGFVIMMDDFGSGYSSLNTLKDIEVDILKIDMKFLPTGHNNTKSEKILASITRMAGWLGMPVIVEGVETKEQKDFLESIGCSYVQGYYYARPMPVKDYEQLMLKQVISENKVPGAEALLHEFDAIWSSDPESSTLLKSVSVPFVIFEYANGKIDILRMNQAYTMEFGKESLERYLLQQESYRLLTAIDETVLSEQNGECECLFIMPDGSGKWYQVRLIFIGTVEKTSLISATFSDVTKERSLEKELNTVFRAIKDKPRSKGSLLVIDDVEVSREVLRNMFEEEFDVICANDGQEGLELLKENNERIAAVLLDMIMPRMSGQEFLSYKNKLSEAADIPVIIISSEDDEDTQINMLKNGVNDYVTKPFVPALVKRRLHNVLEYNSRFRAMVQEYKELNTVSAISRDKIGPAGYTIGEVREMMRFLEEVFNLVRLVDPKETAVITIEKNGTIRKAPYSCFEIWGKKVRCENCSSMCAMNGKCAVNKFELLKQDVFYVVSKPVLIHLGEGKTANLVLEIASRISEQQEAPAKLEDVYQLIENTHNKIYLDPLTEAYNRRFLDEMLFLHHGQNSVARQVAVIMLDLFHFKQTNDLFGHQTGDKVLRGVVKALKSQMRLCDSIIRFGGDEFVVILTNCEEEQIPQFIERFVKAVAEVKYGPNDTIATEADFGYAYEASFVQKGSMLSDMISKADQQMYQNKRKHKNSIVQN